MFCLSCLYVSSCYFFFFFLKQKTAYEMRISDWSSDVCSSDLMRAGNWLRSDGVQLTGKTVGLLGFGGIAAEMARLCLGAGMKVLAWNRSPKSHPGDRKSVV